MFKEEAIKQLLNIKSILFQIDEMDYKSSLLELRCSTIGMHVRHVLEFYECLLFCNSKETVNYDKRKRNLLLEENIKYAENFITEIIDNISKISCNKRVLVVSSFQNEELLMESSLYREICYNIEHTVHHLAIISMVTSIHFNYINLSNDIGFTNCTLQYLESQKNN